MPITLFERAPRATILGLSRFALWLPILLRAALLALFIWYGSELYCKATGPNAVTFLIVMGAFFLLTLIVVMGVTWWEYLKSDTDEPASVASPLWPFVLINLVMILIVSVISKWERDRGLEGFTHGLLGFTQHWVQKIGILLTGGR